VQEALGYRSKALTHAKKRPSLHQASRSDLLAIAIALLWTVSGCAPERSCADEQASPAAIKVFVPFHLEPGKVPSPYALTALHLIENLRDFEIEGRKLSFEIKPTQGSFESLTQLESLGECHSGLAIVQADVLYHYSKGEHPQFAVKPTSKVRGVAYLFPEWLFVTTSREVPTANNQCRVDNRSEAALQDDFVRNASSSFAGDPGSGTRITAINVGRTLLTRWQFDLNRPEWDADIRLAVSSRPPNQGRLLFLSLPSAMILENAHPNIYHAWPTEELEDQQIVARGLMPKGASSLEAGAILVGTQDLPDGLVKKLTEIVRGLRAKPQPKACVPEGPNPLVVGKDDAKDKNHGRLRTETTASRLLCNAAFQAQRAGSITGETPNLPIAPHRWLLLPENQPWLGPFAQSLYLVAIAVVVFHALIWLTALALNTSLAWISRLWRAPSRLTPADASLARRIFRVVGYLLCSFYVVAVLAGTAWMGVTRQDRYWGSLLILAGLIVARSLLWVLPDVLPKTWWSRGPWYELLWLRYCALTQRMTWLPPIVFGAVLVVTGTLVWWQEFNAETLTVGTDITKRGPLWAMVSLLNIAVGGPDLTQQLRSEQSKFLVAFTKQAWTLCFVVWALYLARALLRRINRPPGQRVLIIGAYAGRDPIESKAQSAIRMPYRFEVRDALRHFEAADSNSMVHYCPSVEVGLMMFDYLNTGGVFVVEDLDAASADRETPDRWTSNVLKAIQTLAAGAERSRTPPVWVRSGRRFELAWPAEPPATRRHGRTQRVLFLLLMGLLFASLVWWWFGLNLD
jgi:hypothetical protein